jgi:hypothetical protein
MTMHCRSFVYVIALLLLCSSIQAQERLYSVSLCGSFTTSAKLFYAPDDPDYFSRHLYLPIDNTFGFGFDIRRSIEETGLQIGVSAEYLSKTEQFTLPQTSIKVNDGFIAVPIEATGYFIIPFSSDDVQLYMGGGGGVYWGTRIYDYNSIKAQVTGRKLGYGIHILSGLQYNFHPLFALRSEVKFRDIQFTVTNAFPPNGRQGILATNQNSTLPFNSRISIDGMQISLGLVSKF